MGNRAVITTPAREIGLYVHWNGGRDTIAPLLKYCDLQGYRSPSSDTYGWARLCQVLGNFFGGSTCVGIGPYSDDDHMNPGDNGIYVIEGWDIVERIYPEWNYGREQDEYDFDEMLREFDARMPKGEQLGDFLDAVEVPISQLKVGDEVWMRMGGTGLGAYPVVGFGQPDYNRIVVWEKDEEGKQQATYPPRPYVAMLDHDGDYSWNSNNYPKGDTARIRPRKRSES